MKVNKGHFQTKTTIIPSLEDPINNVLKPFDFPVKRNEGTILLSVDTPKDCWLQADWEVFELILFNFVQNAVKYNKKKGVVAIIAKVTNQQLLEVQVIDTGVGIDKQRQNLLFKPFLELHQTQSMQLVKDNSIGLGLSCSKVLTKKLGGSVQLVESQANLTVFRFKLPIRCPPIINNNQVQKPSDSPEEVR